MNIQHRGLASGRWKQLSFFEQMANIGSEVERALNWQAKHNLEYCRQASGRALELIDLSLDNLTSYSRIKEVARLRELIVDYFYDVNQFMSTEASWRRYFLAFAYAARKGY